MSTLLYYNNQAILSGQSIPFVGRQDSPIRYGERWGVKSTISLHGQITGCTSTDVINAQNNLILAFAQDFQTFQIVESGQLIYSKPYSIIRSVNFSESNYAHLLNYDVTIDGYEQDMFSGTFGVVDPTDQWSFEETRDHLVNISHTVSARGFNTTSGASNAFQNAANFVLSRTGLNPNLTPYFINTISGFHPCLKTVADRPDRFNGSYSITENYIADAYFGLDGVLRYTVSFDCDQVGKTKVAVQGNVDGCGMVSDVTAIRNRYSGFDVYGTALSAYNLASTGGILNPSYISSGVNEDPYTRKLSFNVVFDNWTGASTYLDYAINMESGDNGITTVRFEGHIKGHGDLQTRWANVQAYYSTLDAYGITLPIYNEFANGSYPLNPNLISSGTTFNSFQGQIDINASWNNKDLPPSGFRDFSYTLNYLPALQKVTFVPLIKACDPSYYVADLGYTNRAAFSMDGNGKIACGSNATNAISYLKQFANSTFGSLCPKTRAVLENNEIITGIDSVSFKFGWTAESSNTVSTGYTNINNLSL